jgi:segregation and condensation protein A
MHQVEPFVVELERFQGPLDLLLHLIRAQDIDIFDIPIARITDQFVTALSGGLEEMPLDRAGEFLEMTATLVRIKAQLLLPRTDHPDWEEDPRSELVRRLLEYEHFQDVVHVLSSAEAQRGRHYGKGYVEQRGTPLVSRPVIDLTLDGFLRVAARIPESIPPATVRPPSQTVTVEEKASLLRRLLKKAKRISFERLFRPWGTRSHAVAAFLAALELAKQQVVRIEQVEPFSSIWLLRGGSSDAAGASDTPAEARPEGAAEALAWVPEPQAEPGNAAKPVPVATELAPGQAGSGPEAAEEEVRE